MKSMILDVLIEAVFTEISNNPTLLLLNYKINMGPIDYRKKTVQ